MTPSTAPNILIILADQLVPFLTSPYGDALARTPALEALADEGVRFDAAYTPSPLCAPARAALLAGRHASSVGVFDNASIMASDVPTIGHYLALAGYDTVLSGKMHMIGPDQLHGFEHRLTTDVFPAGLDWVPVPAPDGSFPAGGHARHYALPDPGVRPWTIFQDYDDEAHRQAVRYVRERGRTGATDPFAMIVSFHHPHDPFHVPQEYWDRFEGVDFPLPNPRTETTPRSTMDEWADAAHATADYDLADPESARALRRAYAAAVSYIDDKIAQLVATLRDEGEFDNTLILVSSDHGDMLTERGMVQKRTFYEWSSRIPLIVRMPHAEWAGTVVDAPVSLIDILPTLVDVVGIPAEECAPWDGSSLLPVMAGQAEPERVVFSEYHLEKVHAPCFMVRRGSLKYVLVHEHDEQLFDLATDPDELRDLSDDPRWAAQREELRALLVAEFDIEGLVERGRQSLMPRAIVAAAMRATGQHWDYEPRFDPSRRYVR